MKPFQTCLVLLLSLWIFSCSETETKDRFTITGNIRNAAGEKLIFREMGVDSVKDIDSVVLDDKGLFRFTTQSAEPGLYILKFSSGPGIILSLDQGDVPVITADLSDNPFQYHISGSSGSGILENFFRITRQNQLKADSLRAELMENRDAPDFYALSLRFDTLFQELVRHQKDVSTGFIEKNPSSLSSLIILNYPFGMKPLFTQEEDLPIFLQLDSNLAVKYPANRHVTALHNRIAGFRQQKIEGRSPVN